MPSARRSPISAGSPWASSSSWFDSRSRPAAAASTRSWVCRPIRTIKTGTSGRVRTMMAPPSRRTGCEPPPGAGRPAARPRGQVLRVVVVQPSSPRLARAASAPCSGREATRLPPGQPAARAGRAAAPWHRSPPAGRRTGCPTPSRPAAALRPAQGQQPWTRPRPCPPAGRWPWPGHRQSGPALALRAASPASSASTKRSRSCGQYWFHGVVTCLTAGPVDRLDDGGHDVCFGDVRSPMRLRNTQYVQPW